MRSNRASDPRSVAEMFGELLREAGVLLLVFGVLEVVLKQDADYGPWLWTRAVASVMFTVMGIVIERRRAL